MLPRSLRIAREHFNSVFRSARVYRGDVLSLYAKPSQELGFAVVVAKKILKRAVDRHRTKRVVMSAVEDLLPFSLGAPHTFVFRLIKKPESEEVLRAEAKKLIAKAIKGL